MKELILLIEDDEELLETTTVFLEEEGFEVISATDGTNGIQKALKHIPALIICDILLPGLDGFEVYKALKNFTDASFIPFIFLTAKAEKDDVRAGMQMGADDYITKPFDFNELLTAVKTRIQKRKNWINATQENSKALLHNSLVGIFILYNNQIIFHNSKFRRITGYSSEYLENADFISHVALSDQSAIQDKITKVLKGVYEYFKQTVHLKDASGNITPYVLYAGLTSVHGKKALLGSLLEESQESPDEGTNKEDVENIYTRINNLLFSNEDIPVDLKNKLKQIVSSSKEHHSSAYESLTRREVEVLQKICTGLSTSEMAEQLFVSERTIDGHRANLLDKTQSKNTAELVVFAIKHGYFEI